MKRLRITVEGKSYEVEVELLDESFAAPAVPHSASSSRGRVAAPQATPKLAAPQATPKQAAPAKSAAHAGAAAGALVPAISGCRIDHVAVGDVVEEGKVVTLEAMKMNTWCPPVGGTVESTRSPKATPSRRTRY